MVISPRALILGSGTAGIGHALAMRRAGAEVVAMASRTESRCRATAERLDIPRWGTDWRQMIADIRPDIVAVATPGGAHLEMCEAAIEMGSHVFCDKPLATTAAGARHLYELAARRGVKTAFAECYRYQPHVLWARELVQSDVVGPVHEVECVSHFQWPRLLPFGWIHRLDEGGGRLSNHLTHTLSMVQHIVGGEPLAAMGEARNDLRHAPIGEHARSFAGRHEVPLTPETRLTRDERALTREEAEGREWAEVDSEWSYTALIRIGDPARSINHAVSALFRHMCLTSDKNPEYMAVYGAKGTIHIDGRLAHGPLYLRTSGTTWDELPIPDHIVSGLPPEADDMQRNWDQLAREFVADVRLGSYSGYQTFHDGWIYQQVIEIVRSGSGWTTISASTVPNA